MIALVSRIFSNADYYDYADLTLEFVLELALDT